MISRTEYVSSKILPYDLTGNLGVGLNCQISLDFFESVGICDGTPATGF